jgi:membrane protein
MAEQTVAPTGWKKWGFLFKETYKNWQSNRPFRVSAVISYYTIFALPGLLIVVINLAGSFFGEEALKHEIFSKTHDFIGDEAANSIEKIVINALSQKGFTISNLIGIATMLFGATGVFYQMQQSLNDVYKVVYEGTPGLLQNLKNRLFSFGMILVIGFLLMVSLVISGLMAALHDVLLKFVPESLLVLFQFSDLFVSLLIITFLFAMMFKFLPDVKVKFRDLWKGSFISAFLFVVAKLLLAYYFQVSDPASTYGAAGGVVLLMIWVTYSAMIFLFGAELTRLYVVHYGSGYTLKPMAKKISFKRNKTAH